MIIDYENPWKKFAEEFTPHAQRIGIALSSLIALYKRRNLGGDQVLLSGVSLVPVKSYCKTSMQFTYFIMKVTIKGYLRYNTITSQNMSSEAQIKNYFYFVENYVPFSKYSSFSIFNHPIIFKICDVTMSISTWHKVYFLNISFEPQLMKSPNLTNR